MKYLADTCTVSATLQAFFAVVATLPFDEADAQAAAAIRAALARGLVLVTSNVGEFQRVGGLQVEDWR